jgi:hypothetical protein
MKHATLALAAVLLGTAAACTPSQRADARTALNVSQCVNAIALRHLDSGADLTDLESNAVLASEIAVECGLPLLSERPAGEAQ